MEIRRRIRYRYTGRKRVLLAAAGSFAALVFNLAVIRLVTIAGIPLFLDTIGAGTVTVLFGFRAGAAVAVATHIAGELLFPWPISFLPFVFVHLASVLIIHQLQKHERFHTIVDAVVAVGLVALVNAVAGSIVSLLFYGGLTGHSSDYLVSGFISTGLGMFWAGFWGRIPINLVDKCVTVFIVYGLKKYAEGRFGREEAGFSS